MTPALRHDEPDVVHLVVGPGEHGVVRHGVLTAAACDQRLVRAPDVDAVGELPPCDVVHVPFTDRLFGGTVEAAAAAFEKLAGQVGELGATVSVTLHDVPHDDSPLQRRRREGYRRVVGASRGVVVNSRLELSLVECFADGLHALRVIPLPVATVRRDTPGPLGTDVAVLGFVFPDRGYEDVIAALPDDDRTGVTALGRAADGHEELPAHYAAMADGRWRCTGYLPDEGLADALLRAGVPVAPNRRVTASASINEWLAHGRRPLVPDSPYTRELVRSRPGTVRVYDPDDPDSLAGAIRAGLDDPSLTVLAPGTAVGPTPADAATCYRRHLAACVPPRAETAPGGGVLVPGNRWDLIGTSARPATVSVVIPYFDAQASLDLVLAALDRQTAPPAEIIVVDDGSPESPDVTSAGTVPVIVRRQDDLGFRAARARNLGADAASGEVLVFLDGDTVPEAGFLEALTRLPAACADAVTVGRRRHTDFADVTPDGVAGWLRDDPVPLPEPAWLEDAYAASGDLLRHDRRDYRYVISAVLAVPAALFDEIGGFDERFVAYGGEDWELAHRLVTAGAVLAHVPDAVAWHDGPDWAGRDQDASRRTAQKNAETAMLSMLLPDPQARGDGRWSPYPSVVVLAGHTSDLDALATVRSAAAADCAFWFADVTGPQRDVVLADPAVHVGTPPSEVLARAWCRLELHAAADLGGVMAIAELAARHGCVATPAVTARATRAVLRTRRHVPDLDDRSLAAERLFGYIERSTPDVAEVPDLARWLRGQR